MDFTEFRVVGQSIDDDYDQLNNGHGYDHNWIIDGEEGNLNIVAEVIEDTSGIKWMFIVQCQEYNFILETFRRTKRKEWSCV